MRKILTVGLLGVSVAGYAIAQQATGRGAEEGKAGEEAKAEIMKFEKEKVPLLLKGGDTWASWLEKMDSKDIAKAIKGGNGKATLATVSGGKLWASMKGKT